MKRWDDARELLCMRLDSLGDVLMCTPALRALRQARAGRRITLLGSPAGLAAAPYVPEVDAAIAYDAPWMKHGVPQDAGADLAIIERLRTGRFDAAVIFTTYTQSALPAALLASLAGIPLRLAHCRENPYRLLSDWVPDPEPQHGIRHEVRRQLDLVANAGCATADLRLSFRVPGADLDWARQRLAAFGIDGAQPWILMHPGASAASRRYPLRHWREVLRLQEEGIGLPVVLSGSRQEVALIDSLRAAAGVDTPSLAGQLSLGQLGALIRLASVMVVGNTGPAHMAAAIGTPVVVPYALTNPQHTPWQVRSHVLVHDVPCRGCCKSECPQGHHDCLEAISPREVVAALAGLLSPAQPEDTGHSR